MASRRAPGKGEQRQGPPILTIALVEAQRLIADQLERGRQIRERQIGDRSSLAAAKDAYNNWVDYNRDLLRRILTTDEPSDEFARSIHLMYVLGDTTLGEDIEEFRSDIGTHLRRLESISDRLPLFDNRPELASAAAPGTEIDMKRVFVVHGHNLAVLDRVVRLLRDLDLEPVVLREQANQGRTIIEKFEAHTDVAFAVVILTADDIGGVVGTAPEELRLRARQNVVLELGFFIGKLGRRSVVSLLERRVEVPSDIDGVLYIPMDTGDSWRLLLAKEMKAAGLPVDLNRL